MKSFIAGHLFHWSTTCLNPISFSYLIIRLSHLQPLSWCYWNWCLRVCRYILNILIARQLFSCYLSTEHGSLNLWFSSSVSGYIFFLFDCLGCFLSLIYSDKSISLTIGTNKNIYIEALMWAPKSVCVRTTSSNRLTFPLRCSLFHPQTKVLAGMSEDDRAAKAARAKAMVAYCFQ